MEKNWKIFWIVWFPLMALALLWYFYEQKQFDTESTEDIPGSISIQLYWYPSSPNKVAWQENHLLNWTHFDAEPDISSEFEAVIWWELKAERGCGDIENMPNRKFVIVNSTAYMYQDKSWTKNRTSTYGLLLHEQRHFDLVEVFARKLQNRIDIEILDSQIPCRQLPSKFAISPVIDEQILTIEKEERKLHELVQCLFDNQTDHNKNPTTSPKWNGYIKDWLKDGINMTFLDNEHSIFTVTPRC